MNFNDLTKAKSEWLLSRFKVTITEFYTVDGRRLMWPRITGTGRLLKKIWIFLPDNRTSGLLGPKWLKSLDLPEGPD